MTEAWESGFGAGVLWAAAQFTGACDQAMTATELRQRGGIIARDFKQRGLTDHEAVQTIIAALLAGRDVDRQSEEA